MTVLGTLQPELYKRETTIVMASKTTSGKAEEGDGAEATAFPFGEAERTRSSRNRRNSAMAIGRLHFRLSYDFNKSDLIVNLIEGKCLLSFCLAYSATTH